MLCFQQKTAYELRISDWSSDVCSSVLEVWGFAKLPSWEGRVAASPIAPPWSSSAAMPLLDPYTADLDRLAAADRRRALQPRKGVDFSSNDYLGLAASAALAAAARAATARGVPLGAGSSEEPTSERQSLQ